MIAKQHTSYLCGYFTSDICIKELPETDGRWERILYDKKESDLCKHFYYPEFVDFLYQTKDSVNNDSTVAGYNMKINKECNVSLWGRHECRIFIDSLRIYVFPCNIVIYAIKVIQNNVEMNDVTGVMSILRNLPNLNPDWIGRTFMDTLQTIRNLCNRLKRCRNVTRGQGNNDFSDIIENGNKLKIYQFTLLGDISLNAEEHEKLLFETGTLSPIGSYDGKSEFSPSPKYFRQIMDNNQISIFNNWKGLALLDTFTIIGFKIPEYIAKNWDDSYFNMLYLHSLFLKGYLFGVNERYHSKKNSMSELCNEFTSFEYKYCFHKISYNFMPLEIYKIIDKGLEINEERELLYRMMEQENEEREKCDDRKMNNLLFLLTCFTLLSTIWDASCLFNTIIPFETAMESAVDGYRIVSFALTLILLILVMLSIYRSKKRKR